VAFVRIQAGGVVSRRDLKGRTTFGRLPEQDVQLLDGQASKAHFVIVERNGVFLVRDEGSLNGTLVNGVRLDSEQALVDGDEIVVGGTTILFCANEPREERREVARQALNPGDEALVRLARTLLSCGDAEAVLRAGLEVICTEAGVSRAVLYAREGERFVPRSRRMPPGEELVSPPLTLFAYAAERGAAVVERIDAGHQVAVAPLSVGREVLGVLWLALPGDAPIEMARLTEQARLVALAWRAWTRDPDRASHE
jgi:pSer/pThr/pTyr-binding forkhead associated (FHA) protein